MSNWNKVHITDKSGKEFFVCNAPPMSTFSEIKNLKAHIAAAKSNPSAYKFLNVESAKVMLNNTPYDVPAIDDDELLNLLGI